MTDAWLTGTIHGATGPAPLAVVIKFGGSLLDRPDWPRELLAAARRGNDSTTVVVGGGAIVDGLRAIDVTHPLPTATTHRLAIDALGLTARLAAAATGLPLVAEPPAAGVAILDVPAWLGVGGRFDRLPVGWHVTSDSIAAFVAAAIGAGLVLAKSVPPPEGDRAVVAAAGWVDPWFPEAASRLASIEWTAPASGSPIA